MYLSDHHFAPPQMYKRYIIFLSKFNYIEINHIKKVYDKTLHCFIDYANCPQSMQFEIRVCPKYKFIHGSRCFFSC